MWAFWICIRVYQGTVYTEYTVPRCHVLTVHVTEPLLECTLNANMSVTKVLPLGKYPEHSWPDSISMSQRNLGWREGGGHELRDWWNCYIDRTIPTSFVEEGRPCERLHESLAPSHSIPRLIDPGTLGMRLPAYFKWISWLHCSDIKAS